MATYVEETIEFKNKKKLHWGAIFAGMVVVLAVQLTLGLLGIGFGAGAIDPLVEKNPLEGLGTGSAIWAISTLVLSLFAGGWVAGRLGGSLNNVDSMLHGVVTWGLASLVSFYLVSTTVGSIVSGTTGILGRALGAAGQTAGAAAPELVKTVGREFGIEKVDYSAIKEEARNLAQNPQAAGNDLNVLIDRVFSKGDTTLSASDREEVVTALTSRTSMSRAEAETTVDNWQKLANDAKAKFAQVAQQAEQKARETADATARGVSKAAVWTFVGLMIGLLAASMGGWLGAPDRTPIVSSPRLYRSAA